MPAALCLQFGPQRLPVLPIDQVVCFNEPAKHRPVPVASGLLGLERRQSDTLGIEVSQSPAEALELEALKGDRRGQYSIRSRIA
jgi:hypothetical protein